MDHEMRLRQLKERFDLPRQIVERFEVLFSQSPDTARTLARDLADISGVGGGPDSPDDPFEAVVSLFRSNRNAPMSRREIEEQSGLGENVVHRLMYKTHKNEFESMPSDEGGRAKVYKLVRLNGTASSATAAREDA